MEQLDAVYAKRLRLLAEPFIALHYLLAAVVVVVEPPVVVVVEPEVVLEVAVELLVVVVSFL